jgi:hypothetical protein
MKDLDALISELSTEAVVVGKPATLTRVVCLWVAELALYVSAIFFAGLYTLRPDLLVHLTDPLFVMEISLLTLLALSTVVAAAVLSFPDSYQKPALVDLPVGIFAIFVAILEVEWVQDIASTTLSFEGAKCLACIMVLSLIPAFSILYKMRHLATTHPHKACALAILCSFSVGALILRLSEPTDVISHIVVWHYAPKLVVSML